MLLVRIVFVVEDHTVSELALPSLVRIEEVSGGVVVSIDEVAVVVVLREPGLGATVQGRRALACRGVEGDDGRAVGRLFVEVFADFALPLRSVPSVDQEEGEEDGEYKADDANPCGQILPEGDSDDCPSRQLA